MTSISDIEQFSVTFRPDPDRPLSFIRDLLKFEGESVEVKLKGGQKKSGVLASGRKYHCIILFFPRSEREFRFRIETIDEVKLKGNLYSSVPDVNRRSR